MEYFILLGILGLRQVREDYVFGWMSHPTYVISLYPQAK